jgi:hypothetical protein
MKLSHICSVDSCIEILFSGQYVPAYSSPQTADSGINCFIEGRDYNKSQYFKGVGVEIQLEWMQPLKEVSIHEPFPLKPNILYNQECWRAIIPAKTDQEHVRAIGFKITTPKVGLKQRFKLWILQRRLKKGAIHIRIGRV